MANYIGYLYVSTLQNTTHKSLERGKMDFAQEKKAIKKFSSAKKDQLTD